MKKYGEFINEEFTPLQDKYSKLTADLFWDNGELQTNINYDKQGYMMVNSVINISKPGIFTNNINKTKQRIDFIIEISKSSVNEPYEIKKENNITIFFTFDFIDMNNIPNIFKSYNTITKFKI